MRILFISLPSLHAIRWIDNLKDSQHELFWFDILNRGPINTTQNIKQIVNWKRRKLPALKGEYRLYKKYPTIFKKIQGFLEITEIQALEDIITKIQPDLIHSFELHSCTSPILPVMERYKEIKWLYSCWGSDLYYKGITEYQHKKIKKVLGRINYLHTDCARDHGLADQIGFKGTYMGKIPGGGGYDLKELYNYKLPFYKRKKIIIKGYEHRLGRGLNIIKALERINKSLTKYEIVIFGAHPPVFKYCSENNKKYKIYSRHELTHNQVVKLMGEALIYIGNSISDGIPNTLLEAIIMGAFPIQSNPGGATEEVIKNNINGTLIEDPENIDHITKIISTVLNNEKLQKNAFRYNEDFARKHLDYTYNQQKIINIYSHIEKELIF